MSMNIICINEQTHEPIMQTNIASQTLNDKKTNINDTSQHIHLSESWRFRCVTSKVMRPQVYVVVLSPNTQNINDTPQINHTIEQTLYQSNTMKSQQRNPNSVYWDVLVFCQLAEFSTRILIWPTIFCFVQNQFVTLQLRVFE